MKKTEEEKTDCHAIKYRDVEHLVKLLLKNRYPFDSQITD